MKKKVLAIMMAVSLCITGLCNLKTVVKAADTNEATQETTDPSVFEAVDALVGEMKGTRGVYLASGYSIINKISSTKVGVGGITNAALKCRVSVNAILEKLSGGSWTRVTSWSDIVASGYKATVDTSKTVSKGYYYRVRCNHTASSDGSSSCTSSLWM